MNNVISENVYYKSQEMKGENRISCQILLAVLSTTTTDLDIHVGDVHSHIAGGCYYFKAVARIDVFIRLVWCYSFVTGAFVNFDIFENSEIEILEKTLDSVLKYDHEIAAVCAAAAEVDW